MKSRKPPIDLVDELGTLTSAIDGARILAELGECDPPTAPKMCAAVRAMLTLVAERLRALSRSLDEGGRG